MSRDPEHFHSISKYAYLDKAICQSLENMVEIALDLLFAYSLYIIISQTVFQIQNSREPDCNEM